MVSMSASAAEADATVTIPPQPTASIRYLLDLAAQKGETVFDGRQIEPLIDFLVSPKSADTLYRADGSFEE